MVYSLCFPYLISKRVMISCICINLIMYGTFYLLSFEGVGKEKWGGALMIIIIIINF